MPQGTTFLLGRGWPNTEALKGKIWEVRRELMSLSQRHSVSLGDSTSRGIPPSRAGLAALGGFCAIPLCSVSLSCILLLAIRRGLLVTLSGPALELMP